MRDLDAHRSRVEALAGQPGKIKQTDWMDMFFVSDPGGNEIVLAVTDPARHPINLWSAGPTPPAARE